VDLFPSINSNNISEIVMTYIFTGFFATSPIKSPSQLPEHAVWREITHPFIGIGLLLPDFEHAEEKESYILDLASKFGFSLTSRWIFLDYVCWAGNIDSVYGFGCVEGEQFGPIEESNYENVENAYVEIMSRIGVSANDALYFEPFVRGYWGET
jgi:hypothetical protein